MFVVIHTHQFEIKSVQRVDGDETDARNLAKDLAEKEIGEPLNDQALADLEECNSVRFTRGCPVCGLEYCQFDVKEVTV